AMLITTESMEVGGINYIADVMNKVDRSTEKFIFDELGMRDPKLAEQIRQKMFVFEDIVGLDPMSIQTFINEVDAKDLAIAIKGSTADVAEVIYANMSSRKREATQTDVEYLHNVRMRDVEEAQQRIVAVIRRLEEEGTVTISKGGQDEIIA
ncbi:MAG: flagellar motor switch protein FliG, partial [Oscillospiraceae bacterium]|nr:flagellar motor switch protein FliG [Oscillospiraceae bacterium]